MLLGRAQPIPDRVAVLHLGDMCALPCWIGITPGKTTLEQAIKRLSSVFKPSEYPNSDNIYVVFVAPEVQLSVWFITDDQKIVTGIQLSDEAISELPIGDAMSVLGQPRYLAFNSSGITNLCGLLVNRSWVGFGQTCNGESSGTCATSINFEPKLLQPTTTLLLIQADQVGDIYGDSNVNADGSLKANEYYGNYGFRYYMPWHGFGRCYSAPAPLE